MTHYPDHQYAPARPQQRWKPTVLFWIVAAVLLLLLIPFALVGGLGMVLFILGLAALLTGLYAFLFKRRSWVGLPHRRSGALVAVSGFVALILGAGVVGATAAPRVETDKATLVSPVEQRSATATPTPTPTATNPANTTCTTAAETRKYTSQTLICTAGSDQRLVWMTEADSKRVLAEKAAAEQAAAEKIAAEKAAAEQAAAAQAAAEKAAADKAAADHAAAQQAAAEQAAAAQAAAAQAAAEQAARDAAARQAAPVAPAAPAPSSVYYANCAAAKAAGAAPLYRGQPGYRPGMDGDSDGVACER